MSSTTLAGSLADFPLGDLLQFVALSRRTGRIDIERPGERAVIVMRDGRLLYAACGSAKESLGHQLIARGWVSPGDLERALTRHRRTPQSHLGTALVELGLLGHDDLVDLISEQIEGVVAELMLWSDGSFSFTPLRLADDGEVEVDARRLGLEDGVSTDQVLLRVSSREDEWSESHGTLPRTTTKRPSLPETHLRSIIQEIGPPLVTSEVTVRILGHARRLADRGVLFAARTSAFAGIGTFGLDPPASEVGDRLRDLRIPVEVPSILAEAVARGRWLGRSMPRSAWDREILAALGPDSTGPAAAIPLSAGGRALLILYLDNHPTTRPLPNLAHLESQIQEAGQTLLAAAS